MGVGAACGMRLHSSTEPFTAACWQCCWRSQVGDVHAGLAAGAVHPCRHSHATAWCKAVVLDLCTAAAGSSG
jgi:hypothetical protein